MRRIYLDNAATTHVAKEVLEAMMPYFSEKFGNASSLHSFGRETRDAVENSREKISKKLNAKEHKIIFTSGGTEANNLALKGVAFANREKGKHIITTKIEHDCVLNACKWLEKNGFEVTYLNVDKEGFIDLNELENAIRNDTIIVSIMHANNEIGTIADLKAVGEICKAKGVYFHSDTCQSFCKVPIDLKSFPVDLLTINAHKIYGPKGVGALVIGEGVKIDPLLHGGGHELGLRSGTENVPGIVGFAKAIDVIKEKDIEHMKRLSDKLIEGFSAIEESWLNGPKGDKRLCNNVNFTFRFIEGESLLLYLDSKGIAASTGSACSTRAVEPSHVLTAIGLSAADAHGSLRFSVGKDNTEDEIKYVIDVVKESVESLRKISPLTKK
ncbi:cysteine desulfurase NifS [Candidatus Woesearchaeota archaeon]|nr:cysteine desulfurase [Candidatus Woesearchaeota archaeon]RLE41142.1 MAG: cysteine desulfurase NifS [Candidatus Woesearchaeota archaeon]